MTGPAFLLKVGDGSDPQVYTCVAGMRTTAFSFNLHVASISGKGIFTGSSAETRLKSNALSGLIDDYQISFEGGERLQAKFLITRLDYAGDLNGERSYSIALESSGEVKLT